MIYRLYTSKIYHGEMLLDKKKFYAMGIADPGTGSSEGFFFTKDELREIVRNCLIINIPVWLEHGSGGPEIIGSVRYSWVDHEQGLMVIMEFDYTTLVSNCVLEWIRIGLFAGISLGYKSDVEYNCGVMKVVKKTINEVSIVRDPFHKTCRINFVGTTIPMKSPKYISSEAKEIAATDLFPYF